MRIFNAVISMSAPYEHLCDAYNAFGSDVAELLRLQLVAAAAIAPEDQWQHVGSTMECTVDGVTYTMYTEEILLVC